MTTPTDVLLVAYETRSDAVALAETVRQDLVARGHSVAVHLVEPGGGADGAHRPRVIVSLGGDGTFLRAARIAHEADSLVVGVNLGRVGFLLRVSPEQVVDETVRALSGELGVERRVALRVTSESFELREFCLNEVVLERSEPGRMVRVRTFIDSDEFLTYSADGVLVATATGSTGYNFSAGGPVISPELDVLVLTPIAPHFTIDRSVVVGAHQPVRLQILDRDAVIVADGAVVGTLTAGQSIDVTFDPTGVRVAGSDEVPLGSRLRHSLREGHA